MTNLKLEPLVFAIALIAIGVAILMAPTLRYVVRGWKAKRKDIMDGLSSSARYAYFAMFSPSETLPRDKAEASLQFEKLYEEWYGRRYFIVPASLLLITGLCAASLVVFSALQALKYGGNPLFEIPAPAVAALCGAFLWVVNDHISRARRLDFSPADVLWGVLRLVIAVPDGLCVCRCGCQRRGSICRFRVGCLSVGWIAANVEAPSQESAERR